VDIVLKYEGVWQVLFSAELFRKSTVIFSEISGKIPPEISELTTLIVTNFLILLEFDLETSGRQPPRANRRTMKSPLTAL